MSVSLKTGALGTEGRKSDILEVMARDFVSAYLSDSKDRTFSSILLRYHPDRLEDALAISGLMEQEFNERTVSMQMPPVRFFPEGEDFHANGSYTFHVGALKDIYAKGGSLDLSR